MGSPDPLRPTLADRELARDLLLGATSDNDVLLAAAVVRVAGLDGVAAARVMMALATLSRATLRALAPNGPTASLTVRLAHRGLVRRDEED